MAFEANRVDWQLVIPTPLREPWDDPIPAAFCPVGPSQAIVGWDRLSRLTLGTWSNIVIPGSENNSVVDLYPFGSGRLFASGSQTYGYGVSTTPGQMRVGRNTQYSSRFYLMPPPFAFPDGTGGVVVYDTPNSTPTVDFNTFTLDENLVPHTGAVVNLYTGPYSTFDEVWGAYPGPGAGQYTLVRGDYQRHQRTWLETRRVSDGGVVGSSPVLDAGYPNACEGIGTLCSDGTFAFMARYQFGDNYGSRKTVDMHRMAWSGGSWDITKTVTLFDDYTVTNTPWFASSGGAGGLWGPQEFMPGRYKLDWVGGNTLNRYGGANYERHIKILDYDFNIVEDLLLASPWYGDGGNNTYDSFMTSSGQGLAWWRQYNNSRNAYESFIYEIGYPMDITGQLDKTRVHPYDG